MPSLTTSSSLPHAEACHSPPHPKALARLGGPLREREAARRDGGPPAADLARRLLVLRAVDAQPDPAARRDADVHAGDGGLRAGPRGDPPRGEVWGGAVHGGEAG